MYVEKEMFQTEQEQFWAGDFGQTYIARNAENKQRLASDLNFFSEIFKYTSNIDSLIEYGANIGLNLIAIQHLMPDIDLSGLEINKKAFEQLQGLYNVKSIHSSLLDFQPSEQFDFVFVKGVLIHINPDSLHKAYELLYRSSKKYILIAEYYNPTPVSIEYRGEQDKLFKRDFAGEMLDKFKDLKLIAYNFVYRRDPNFPQDDITWFLIEK